MLTEAAKAKSAKEAKEAKLVAAAKEAERLDLGLSITCSTCFATRMDPYCSSNAFFLLSCCVASLL